MQYLNADSALIITIMIVSWLVAFIFNYAMIHTLIKRWKSWEEMNDKEHSTMLGALSLGVFPGIIVWWILGAGAFTGGPVLGLFEVPVLLIWVVILMLVAALGGALVLRQ